MRFFLVVSAALLAVSSGMMTPPELTEFSESVATVAPQGDVEDVQDSFEVIDCKAVETVSRIDTSTQDVQAPSPSPSAAITCTQQTSNARGSYTATLAPCDVTFHRVTGNETDLIDFQTSSLCGPDNGFLTMKEYVTGWADECIGDFARCYSLEHHMHILIEFLCTLDGRVPGGTTHVSVDCKEDKDMVQDAENSFDEAAHQVKRQERIEMVEVKLFNMFLVLGSCVAGVLVISKWIVQPLVVRSTLSLAETAPMGTSGESSSLPVHGRWPSVHDQSYQSSHSQGADGDDESTEDFDMQVPADFDAIPIVAATVVHDDQ
eukprot:Nitzschia sp. Nitz4//scaffold11_size288233//249659//250615//NITZ4_000816-RA/size288233-processed-gene-0.249-mRNA-1//-1//CDS//3329534200//1402//frame0